MGPEFTMMRATQGAVHKQALPLYFPHGQFINLSQTKLQHYFLHPHFAPGPSTRHFISTSEASTQNKRERKKEGKKEKKYNRT